MWPKIWSFFYLFFFIFIPALILSFAVGDDFFFLQISIQLFIIVGFFYLLFWADKIVLSSHKARKSSHQKHRKLISLIKHYAYILKISTPPLYITNNSLIGGFVVQDAKGRGSCVLDEKLISLLDDKELDSLILFSMLSLKEGAFNRSVFGLSAFIVNLVPSFAVKLEKKIHVLLGKENLPQLMGLLVFYFIRPILIFQYLILGLRRPLLDKYLNIINEEHRNNLSRIKYKITQYNGPNSLLDSPHVFLV